MYIYLCVLGGGGGPIRNRIDLQGIFPVVYV